MSTQLFYVEFVVILALICGVIIPPGLSELNGDGTNVCGPRTMKFTKTRTERYDTRCATGTCQKTRIGFVDAFRDEYYCCTGFSQTGTNCAQACDSHRFGENCTQTCNCSSSRCNSISGECECLPGYKGDNCTEQCEKGKYGVNCWGNCTCLNGADCDSVNGTCNCLAGYYGDQCETKTEITTLGDTTNDVLSSGQARHNILSIIIITVSVLIILILVIVIVIIWKRPLLSKWNNLRKSNSKSSKVSDQSTKKDDNCTPTSVGENTIYQSDQMPHESVQPNLSHDNTSNYSTVMPPRVSTGLPVAVEPKYTAYQPEKAKNSKPIPPKVSMKPTISKRKHTEELPNDRDCTSQRLLPRAELDKSQIDTSDTHAVQNRHIDNSKPPPAYKVPSKALTLPTAEPPPSYTSIENSLLLIPPSSENENLKLAKQQETPPVYASIENSPFGRTPEGPAPPIPTEPIPVMHYDIQDATGVNNAYDILNPKTMTNSESSANQPTSQNMGPYDTPNAGAKTHPGMSFPKYAGPNALTNSSSQPPFQHISPQDSLKAPDAGAPYGVIDLSIIDLSHGENEMQKSVKRTPDALTRMHASQRVKENSLSESDWPIDQPTAANPVYHTLEKSKPLKSF